MVLNRTRYLAFDLRSGVQLGDVPLCRVEYSQRLKADYALTGSVDLARRADNLESLAAYYRDMLVPNRTRLVMIPPERIPIPEDPAIAGYIQLPTVAGNYVSTPSQPALAIVGDISFTGWIAPTPLGVAGSETLIGRWVNTANNRSYRVDLVKTTTTRRLTLFWSPDGISNPSAASTVNLPAIGDAGLYWAITFDADNGAAGSTARFYTSLDGTTWTLYDTKTQALATINAGTAPLAIGAHTTGTLLPAGGRFYMATVKNAIGAAGAVPGGSNVFRFDGTLDLVGLPLTATTYTSTSGHTMTVNRSGTPASEVHAPYAGTPAGYSGPRNDETPVSFIVVERGYTDGRYLDIGCAGLWHYWNEYPLTVPRHYVADDQLDIAAALVNWVQTQPHSDLNVWVDPPTPSGVLRDLTVEINDYRPVGEIVADMADVDDGFEFSIESAGGIHGVTDTLTFHYPQQGTVYADDPKTLTLSRLPAALALTEQGPKTALTMVGSGEGADMLTASVQSQALLDAGYPQWPTVDAAKFEGTSAQLNRHALGTFAEMLRRRRTWTVTVERDTDRWEWAGIGIGDEVAVRVPPGKDLLYPEGLTLLQRVVGRSVAVLDSGAENVTYELGDTGGSTLEETDVAATVLKYRVVGTGDSILAMSWGFGGPGGIIRTTGDRWLDFEHGRSPYTAGMAARYSTNGILPLLVASSQPDGWIIVQDNSLQPAAADGSAIPGGADYWRLLMTTVRNSVPDDRFLLYVIPGYLASVDAAISAQIAANAAVMVEILSTHPRAVAYDLAAYMAANPGQFADGQHPNTNGQVAIKAAIYALTGMT